MGLLHETRERVRGLFKKEPIRYEGSASLKEIPDIRYGFFPPHRVGGTQVELVVQDQKQEYGFPLVKGLIVEEDQNTQVRNSNIDELRRQVEQDGAAIYVKGEAKARMMGAAGRFSFGIPRDSYRGTIEVNGQPAYSYEVDLDKPIREHVLQKIIFESKNS